MIHFSKLHGCGNDFVLISDLDDRLDLGADDVRAICARHHGVGADGVLRVVRGEGDAHVFMDYRNADGGVAEMCGNGVRCVATYVLDHGLVDGDAVRVDSRAGVRAVEVTARWPDGQVRETAVDMGAPRPTGSVALRLPGQPAVDIDLTTVSMGNPHAVLLVDDVDKAPVDSWGPHIAHDPAFPDGTNVEFIAVPRADVVRGRVWERGVGETRASGTGASAMAVAARLHGLVGDRVQVDVPGGTLHVDWSGETLILRGPAVEVFSGTLSAAWLRRHGGG